MHLKETDLQEKGFEKSARFYFENIIDSTLANQD